MAEELQEELRDLSPEEQEKLKKLMEKDSKSYRSPTGFFKMLVAVLGAGMVLFYFYTAGIAAVATQYHRGVYVFVTYVLVFLLYPAELAKGFGFMQSKPRSALSPVVATPARGGLVLRRIVFLAVALAIDHPVRRLTARRTVPGRRRRSPVCGCRRAGPCAASRSGNRPTPGCRPPGCYTKPTF